MICVHCSSVFDGGRRDRLYCSPNCRGEPRNGLQVDLRVGALDVLQEVAQRLRLEQIPIGRRFVQTGELTILYRLPNALYG